MRAFRILLALAGALLAGAGTVPALPAVPGPGDDDWPTVRSPEGVFEFQAPPGFSEVPPRKAGVLTQYQYAGEPYANAQIKVYGFKEFSKPEHLASFMKFMETSIGGNLSYVGDSKTRFVTDIQSGNDWWVSQVQGQIEAGWGYAIECLVQKKVYDKTKDVWMKVADSFKGLPPPPETFTIPSGWRVKKNPMYAALGPVDEIKDKQARDRLDGFLNRVLIWLDPDRIERPFPKMFRAALEDDRKFMHRLPVRVLPTAEAFKAAAGDRWYEGAVVVYLPDDPDRPLVVNGAADSPIQEKDVVPEAGAQYAESRLGRMWPWLRSAFALYFDGAYKRGCTPGLFTPEMMKKGKEVFARSPAPFEELMKKDDAGMKALGEDARYAAWGYLQVGLHGEDSAFRGLFRGLLKESADQPDAAPVWEKLVVKFKKDNKRAFNPRDFDSAAKKYFRELKEDKR